MNIINFRALRVKLKKIKTVLKFKKFERHTYDRQKVASELII